MEFQWCLHSWEIESKYKVKLTLNRHVYQLWGPYFVKCSRTVWSLRPRDRHCQGLEDFTWWTKTFNVVHFQQRKRDRNQWAWLDLFMNLRPWCWTAWGLCEQFQLPNAKSLIDRLVTCQANSSWLDCTLLMVYPPRYVLPNTPSVGCCGKYFCRNTSLKDLFWGKYQDYLKSPKIVFLAQALSFGSMFAPKVQSNQFEAKE